MLCGYIFSAIFVVGGILAIIFCPVHLDDGPSMNIYK